MRKVFPGKPREEKYSLGIPGNVWASLEKPLFLRLRHFIEKVFFHKLRLWRFWTGGCPYKMPRLARGGPTVNQ